MVQENQDIWGVDVGTQGVRCTCYDVFGNLYASFKTNYRVSYEKDMVYAKSQDIWSAVVSILREAISNTERSPRALGVTAIIGTVFVDGAFLVIEPVLLWGDQRAQNQCYSIPADITPLTIGRKLCPEHFLPRILWFKEHSPDEFSRTTLVLTIKDWLIFKLTGTIACDEVSAGYYGCFNVKEGKWEADFLDDLGIATSLFPPIKQASSSAGMVSPEASFLTGILGECTVAIGGPDGSVGSFGVGAVSVGDCAIISGTTDVMTYITDQYINVVDDGLILNRSIVPGMFAIAATLGQTGGSINMMLQWFGITYESGFEQLQSQAGDIDPGCDGVSMLGMSGGLRAPYWSHEAKILISGIDDQCTQAHLYRALLENVSFILNDCLSLLNQRNQSVQNIFLGGNGAQNHLWTQIKTDIFGQTIKIPADLESSSFGSALLAAVAAQIFEDVPHAIRSMISYPNTTEVNRRNHEDYKDLYNRYRNTIVQYLNSHKTQAKE